MIGPRGGASSRQLDITPVLVHCERTCERAVNDPFNGDSHYFHVDKPLQDASGRRVENFTRVETFGDKQGNGNQDVNWLKVLGDPESRAVFRVPAAGSPGKPAVAGRRADTR